MALSPGSDDVLAAACDFLERESVEDLVVDDLAERFRIGRAVPRTYEYGDAHVDIRHLSVVRVDEQRAVCECDARFRQELIEGDRILPGVYRYSIKGQINLVKDGCDWLVSDYPLDGLPVRSAFRVYQGLVFSSGDFILTPRMLQGFPGQTSLVLEVVNSSPSKARIRHAYLKGRPRLLMRSVDGLIRGPGHVVAGDIGTFDIGWAVAPRRVPTPLEVEFVIGSAPVEPLHIAFKLPGLRRDASEDTG